MAGKRKQHTAAFKAQVALAALKGDKTINELASHYAVHPTLIHAWKKQLLVGADQVFSSGTKAAVHDTEAEKAELFEQIGRLKMELEWLKKKSNRLLEQLRPLVEPDHPHLSVRRQCELLGLARSSLYYQGVPESTENLRLTRLMGLEAVYPKPKLSEARAGHRIYPYLLRNVSIERSDQVWSTDITYVPLAQGFMYLAAIIDWFSRYVISWRLSNTLDGSFCLEILEEALRRGRPEVFNTDQGVQFTATAWTSRLEFGYPAVER